MRLTQAEGTHDAGGLDDGLEEDTETATAGGLSVGGSARGSEGCVSNGGAGGVDTGISGAILAAAEDASRPQRGRAGDAVTGRGGMAAVATKLQEQR